MCSNGANLGRPRRSSAGPALTWAASSQGRSLVQCQWCVIWVESSGSHLRRSRYNQSPFLKGGCLRSRQRDSDGFRHITLKNSLCTIPLPSLSPDFIAISTFFILNPNLTSACPPLFLQLRFQCAEADGEGSGGAALVQGEFGVVFSPAQKVFFDPVFQCPHPVAAHRVEKDELQMVVFQDPAAGMEEDILFTAGGSLPQGMVHEVQSFRCKYGDIHGCDTGGNAFVDLGIQVAGPAGEDESPTPAMVDSFQDMSRFIGIVPLISP